MSVNINPYRTKVPAVVVGDIATLLVREERAAAFFYNESSATMTIVAGDEGGADDYTYVIPAGGIFQVSGFEAASHWRAYWASATGQARVTEWK